MVSASLGDLAILSWAKGDLKRASELMSQTNDIEET